MTAKRVACAAGISRGTLGVWLKKGVVCPQYSMAPGRSPRFTKEECRAVVALARRRRRLLLKVKLSSGKVYG